ncbi:MAG: hypothetical protein ACT4O9_13310 [Blastocatellia bacterium]
MFPAFLFIIAISVGGFALTYLFEDEEPFLWRLAAGNVIGSAIFGTAGFVSALFFGLNAASVFIALVFTLIPVVFILNGERRKLFERDRVKAKGKLQGASLGKALPFLYYAAFLVLFIFFFDRAMIETDQGIFTGGSNNLGDLPFHLGVIFGFTDGANFPPQNPSFSGAKFSYPFIADFLTASFVKLGIGVRDAMLVQNVAWAFSLLVILERYVHRLIGDRLAARIAPALLFFSGGLGFIWFLGDYWGQTKSFFDFLGSLPKDYTIGDEFRWGNSLITLFITQRSLLLGMPITLIVLGALWKIFTTETQRNGEEIRKSGTVQADFASFIPHPSSLIPFVVGLIAGLLPLVHLHSLAVLFVVTAFLLFLRLDKWREFAAFGIGVCIIAVPELLWSMSGSATRAAEFFAFHFGWDSRETNIVWFWIKNTGIFIPFVVVGIYLVYFQQRREDVKEETRKKEKGKRKNKDAAGSSLITHHSSLLLFYLPFVFLFIVSNAAKLAPWEWDNIKVLIYWFVGSLPFAAIALAWMWRKPAALKIAAAVCFAILIFSGALDVWRTASGQVNYKVFDADAVTVANRIKASASPTALFLNAPTYNTAIVLTGRRSLMRYPGHLSSHGIDYRQREDDVKQMYRGGPAALGLLEKYGIDYVLISPEERNTLAPNEEFFKRFPVIAEAGQYKVYKVK